ncbi:MAG: glycosyltransferase family 4 protein [Cyanobacteria bacterium P01_E01_bin.6]
MKVSLIVSDLSTRGAGRWGGAVRPFLLTQALQQLGHVVDIVGFGDTESVSFSPPNVNTHVLRAKTYPGFVTSACKLLHRLKGDIIYAYKLKPSSFGLGLLHHLATRKHLILDIDDWELSWHGGDRLHYKPSPMKFARDLIHKDGELRQPDHPVYLKWMETLASKSTQITTHTQFLRDRFGGTYVPNGKDVSLFDPNRYDAAKSREKFGLTPYRVLMFPGAPRPYKGLEDILAALDQLDEPDLRLVIVGGSPYDNYDQELMQRWGRWIIQLPKLSYSQMPEVVSAAHVIVVPQRDLPEAKAQFPLKLTDGMAMAKPVLATAVGDIPSILGTAGYIVQPSQVDHMAEAIQCIFDNFGQAMHRGILARKRCIEDYSIDSMASKLSPILQALS